MRLPIDDAIPELLAALSRSGRAVLQAPPGAGKTTRVPLALLPGAAGTILMLEPRRLAVRAAAARMAETLGEPVGATVGYRMRGEARVSDATRIEVVTEGLLTRRLQRDPGLEGVSHLIFDEFHERGLDADLGLALALDMAGALREDLSILVMSATLDAAPVAALMGGAPVVTSRGQAHPVETRWRDGPMGPDRPGARERRLADLALDALASEPGSILMFLPGAAEIGRTAAALAGRLPPDVALHRLHGTMPQAAQRAAVAPAGAGRKVVLATSIAETSLTIQGVRVVIDSGLARRARFDPGTGMGRLVTEPASRAEADQRRGRAGRTEPGLCLRDWPRAAHGARPAQAPPEIATADLAGLALALAEWGAAAADLPFLDPPDPARMAAARDLLTGLGALDGGRITDHGRALAALPLHPRLAHMLAVSGPAAAPLAAALSDGAALRAGGEDLAARLRLLADGDDPALRRVRAEARRLARMVRGVPGRGLSPGAMAALAFPDRIGLRRPGDEPRWLLSGGRGAAMPGDAALAGARLIVACEVDGAGREARVRLAAEPTEAELRDLFGTRIHEERAVAWDPRTRRVDTRIRERLGALTLTERRWDDPPADALAAAAWKGVRDLGLPSSPAADRLRARAALVPGLPDLTDEALLADGAWLVPWLGDARDAAAIRALDLLRALRARLGHEGERALDAAAPGTFVTPLGRRVPVDYALGAPEAALRMQEAFGLDSHPAAGGAPLRLTLLSPAGRPLAVTTDLPGFWRGAYDDVRKEMRGRYPRHPWPERPWEAAPTTRAKPRGR